MRVLFDISTLGLGQLYSHSRGGSFRAEQNITEQLIASGECELLLCANHSSVAYQGCLAYLREHSQLHTAALLSARHQSTLATNVRRAMTAAHQWTRLAFGTNVLPRTLRQSAAVLDRCVHSVVSNASPPVDVFHSSTPLPPRGRLQRGPVRFLTVYDLAYVRFPAIYRAAYMRTAQTAFRSLQKGATASSRCRNRAGLRSRRRAPSSVTASSSRISLQIHARSTHAAMSALFRGSATSTAYRRGRTF